MDFEAALEHAINGEAILFAGAGFSVGAKNLNNQPLKTGGMLAEYFADATDLPADSRLEDAAEAFVELHGDDRLIEVLHNEFTVRNVAGYHLELAKIPWKRIYTTNYDNVLETAFKSVGKALISVSLSDNIRNLPKENPLCVHLNGCVTRLDRETIRSEIKLTDTSYLTATVADSPWAAFFRQDLRLARAVFFVGYSLADLDIKRIVFDNEDLRLKTLFFLGREPRVTTTRLARRFGTTINQMDTESLASTFAKKQESYKPTEPPKLVHYCYEKLEIADVDSQFSDDRFIDLFVLGDVETEFVRRSIYRDLPYYLERTKMDRLTELLRSEVRAIMVHSDLGNGKTLFLEGLKYRALEQGYEVYSLIDRSEDICRETEQILRQNTRTLLVVENYYDWFDVLDYISMNWGQNTKLVLSARSAIHDVTIERLHRSLEISDIPEMQCSEGVVRVRVETCVVGNVASEDMLAGWAIRLLNARAYDVCVNYGTSCVELRTRTKPEDSVTPAIDNKQYVSKCVLDSLLQAVKETECLQEQEHDIGPGASTSSC